MNNITLFQRFKHFVNSKPIGSTYTTDELYNNVGRYENETWWKKLNRQRMYRTSTYQTYLKRLGALEKIKRGKWKVLDHIPDWFYSKHMNHLLGYKTNLYSTKDAVEFEEFGFSNSLISAIVIPDDQRYNPFKSKKQDMTYKKFDLTQELVKLYHRCDERSKSELLEKFPDLDKAIEYAKEDIYEFGSSYTVTKDQFCGPLMINCGIFPALSKKAFIVSSAYEPVIIKEAGYDFIYFKSK